MPVNLLPGREPSNFRAIPTSGNAAPHRPPFQRNGGARRHNIPEPNTYRIDIRDSGNAIPAEHIDHIFEEYTSYAGGRDRSGGGLGLAISRMIIAQHDGRVWAENTRSGPMFSIVLPVHRAEAIHTVEQIQKTA